MKGYSRLVYGLRFLLIGAVLTGAVSCKDGIEESPILIFLTPSAPRIDVNSNEHLFVVVDSRTTHGQHLRLMVESVDQAYGIKEIMDSTFNFTSINYRFDYLVPAYPDSTESLLIFTLVNDLGEQAQIAKRMYINKGASSVKETSGNVIYSTLSSKPSGFSISKLAPVFLADSTKESIDLIDATTATDNPTGVLSRTWTSRTGLLFVKYSGFNYADANAITISNSYKSGIKLSRVSNLVDSDILIVGKADQPIGAIQILVITDLDGIENDKYVFNIKKLETAK